MQTILVGLGIAGILALGLFIVWPETPIKNFPSKGKTIVAFGDSLVEGFGASTGNDFVSRVSREVGEPIINLGVSGNTTEMGLKRVDEVLSREPKVVLLLLGGNDYLRRVPKETTQKNLATIIERIQAKGSIVVLLGVRGGVLGDGFADMYEELSKTYETAYVPDVLDGLFGNAKYMSDGIHPNDAGYALIAQRVATELKPLLE